MNSLPLFVFFHVLTGIHGKGIVSNHTSELNKTENWPCKEFNETDTLFSCFYRNYHQDRECIEIVQMTIYGAMNENFTDEWFVKQSKIVCTDGEGNNRCSEDDCRNVLLSAIESVSDRHNMTAKEKDSHNCDYGKGSVTNDVETSTSWKENGRQKDKKDKRKKEKETSIEIIIAVSALVSILIAASVTITVICYQKHQSKHSLTRSVRQDQIITERVDSSDYNAINYNEMTDMSLPETNKNSYETVREPQAITDIIEQTGDTLTEYESLSNNRTSVEHVYKLESTQNNQYQLLTTQRNVSEHTYEDTELESTQNNQYQLLTTQRSLSEHTYEDTELESTQNNQYQLLTTQRNLSEHTYKDTELESTQNNQYQLLTTQRNLSEHTYEYTEPALPATTESDLHHDDKVIPLGRGVLG